MNDITQAQSVIACKRLCELCVKRGYNFCANTAVTTALPTLSQLAKPYDTSQFSNLTNQAHGFDAPKAQPAKPEPVDAWQPIETAPKEGLFLLAIETDDGYEFAVLPRDSKGNWIHDGEPTFCHSYYYRPTHWQPLPAPPAPQGQPNDVP